MPNKRSRRPSKQTLLALMEFLESPQSWRYGYELSKKTGLEAGVLYPILVRLKRRGLVEAEWEKQESEESKGRPARHMYRLTDKGKVYAFEHMKEHLRSSSSETGLVTA